MTDPVPARPGQQDAFRAFLGQRDYPCLGARSVLRHGLHVLVEDSLADPSEAALARVVTALRTAAEAPGGGPGWRSTAVVFRSPTAGGEEPFERALWAFLRRLSAADPEPWSAQVSGDPADPRFGFSVGGHAFFVIGLHPGASRRARRAPSPVVVFNAHAQFDALRDGGSFARLRDAIRRRDEAWSGSVNPMAVDHGESSEARQYAGRVVPAGWSPPAWDGVRCPVRAAS